MEELKNQLVPVTEEYKNAPATAASDIPQFSTAVFNAGVSSASCKACNQPISGEYYRVNGNAVCGKCAATLKEKLPVDTHAAFMRALLFGAVGALLGLIVYSCFAIFTGLTIGYLALAVGWLVARAMLKGSKGVGGFRYQVAAVLLTYAAISLSSIPIYISLAAKHTHTHSAPATQTMTPSNVPASGQNSDAQPAASNAQPAQADDQQSPQESHPDMVAAIGQLALIGLASPFLELQNPANGLLGLVILFVGLSIAFRMTKAKRLAKFEGPLSA
jgi:hypothetical protein